MVSYEHVTLRGIWRTFWKKLILSGFEAFKIEGKWKSGLTAPLVVF